MKNINLKNKTAFSLIELSIVILIVGIIVAGVTQSSRLISAFKLSTARNLTQSSPVASMKDLTLWWETTSAASFADTEADNSQTVTTWYDINPTSTTKYNATQVSGSGATYTTNCMNSLPCLRFNGSSKYYSYTGDFLAGADYTIFVVEQRRNSRDENYFLSGTSAGALNNRIHLGYRYTSAATFAQFGNDFDVAVSAYGNPIPRIHAFTFSSAVGKYYYMNGATSGSLTDANGKTGLIGNNAATIGLYPGRYFDGDICEIIMFTRTLKTEERRSIESYLGKKWGITVT